MSEEFESPMPPVEEPPKRNTILVAMIIVVFVLLMCCCCTLMGSLWYLYTYGDEIFGLTSRVLLQLSV